jgi:DNA-binding NarL/FixJ family response regulator/signal transduction histidine kinase
MWELFPELDGTEVGARLREAMQAQHPVEFELHFAPTGEWIEAKAYPSTTGLSIHYRNISERKRAAAERERAARRQADVAALGLRALASDDLQPLLDDAVALVARTLDVGLTAVAEILPGSERLLLRAGVGWGDGAVGRVTGTAGRASLVGYTVLAGKPVVADDVAADERFNISPALAERHPVSAVTVVIAGRDEPYGALGAFAQERRSFSEPDVNFMQSVANVLAGAVERSRAYERMIDVRDAERRRIARDLHDEALQDLGETLALAAGGPGTDAPGDALATLVPGLKRVALHLRGAIYDLRLGAEEDRPFLELLEGLVGVHLALADGREVHLDVGRGMPAASLGRRGTEVLSIVGEALVNARRHADARHIRVRVAGSAHRLHVEVSDDGRGFDPDRSPGAGGTGIAGMRERAALLDGSLRVASRPGEGTLIALELPLAAARETAVAEARILLVEDHAAVREAIAAMFEREPDFTVAGQAGTLAEAREMLREVDVAVIDLGLPDGDGASLIADLREASPDAQALVLSASLDREQSARAIESGAAAVLDKAARLDEIVDAVRRLRAGETLLAVDEVIELIRFAGSRRERERGDREALARLTPREREVLQALGEGLDTQAIAERLGISTRTQRNHVASILTKLGVHSQLQAVLFALRYELIQVR